MKQTNGSIVPPSSADRSLGRAVLVYRSDMPMREIRTAVLPTRFQSIGAFLDARENVTGTVEIDLGGIPFHFFYDWQGSDTTFVSFSGTVSTKVEHVPAWAGSGISSGLGLNRILISDPSIILSTGLRLGWYGGSTQQPHLQDDIATLVAGATTGTRPFLFGPSGGGFAALVQAAVLPGTVVLVSNPQTNVARFTQAAVDRYMQTAWGQESLDENRPPFVHEVVSLYERRVDASIIYLQNTGDAEHITRHYSPFRDQLHRDNRAVFLMPNLGQGHMGPDKESFRTLLRVVRDHREWDALTRALRGITVTRDM